MLRKVGILLGDEYTLSEEVLVDELAFGFRDQPGGKSDQFRLTHLAQNTRTWRRVSCACREIASFYQL